MVRYAIRHRIQNVLRDETFPVDTINEAINRVLADINVMGRFQFHQTTEDILLVSGTYSYAVTSTIIAEEVLVYRPGVENYQKIITKGPGVIDAFNADAFIDSGVPDHYYRWGNNWLFDPIPNSEANGQTVRIYHFKDLTMLTSDYVAPGIPARYHDTVMVYGPAAILRPGLVLEDGRKVTDAYRAALNSMVTQEKWEPLISHNLIRDYRFRNMNTWGHVGNIR